jgi:hypothetical protein
MDKLLSNTTCFKANSELGLDCQANSCRHWINCAGANNCSILASRHGPKTLQEIGDLCGLTRMRICQIEKSALRKIREYMSKLNVRQV